MVKRNLKLKKKYNRHLKVSNQKAILKRKSAQTSPKEINDDGTYAVYKNNQGGEYDTYGPIYGMGSTNVTSLGAKVTK